jgi:hypothetical protein
MLTIEHNPTQMEKAFSEGKAPSPEGENRLDEEARTKGRNNDGPGPFARLLAGLVSKKTQRQPETQGAGENEISRKTPGSRENEVFRETAENGAKKGALLHLTKEKGLLFKENDAPSRNALKKESRLRETIRDQDRSGPDSLTLEFIRQFPVQDDPLRKDSAIKLVSFKDDQFVPVKDGPERKFPFRKGEMPENQLQAEARNIAMQSKKAEKPSQTEELPGDRAEAKKAGRKRNTVSLEVQDLRTHTGSEAGTIAERGLKGAEEARNGPVTEIVLELKPGGKQNDGPAGTAQQPPAGESFEQLLARELRGDLSADIVRQAAVILRDGGEGTIRLSLKPETLGKVKIHLEMAENRISGHIFVESEEALRAFEREIRSLEQSFRDSGFEASLNAALDYRNDGQRWKEKEVIPFYSERFAASYEETNETEFSDFGFGISAVNMLA